MFLKFLKLFKFVQYFINLFETLVNLFETLKIVLKLIECKEMEPVVSPLIKAEKR